MTHYLLDSREPHAIITSNRQELKLYHGNNYYLNDGNNFEIRIFNPLAFKLGVQIIFNGIKKSEKLLVLNPGQDVTLDRFIDEQRKMVYETYEVNGNSESVQKAIENNGLIEIKFYKEKGQKCNFNTKLNYSSPNTTVRSSGLPHYTSTPTLVGGRVIDRNAAMKKWSPVLDKLGVTTDEKRSWLAEYAELHQLNENIGYSTLSNCNGMGTVSSSNNIDNSEYVAENIDKNIKYAEYIAETKLETGRIEVGETSDQNMKEVHADFESDPIKIVTYKLLPISQKAIESKEIRQYCTSCGLRIRKDSWVFCPSCGEKLI